MLVVYFLLIVISHVIFILYDCIVFHSMFILNLQAGPHECLKDVALKILQNKVATVPIIHSSSEDGSCPQLLHLASLSGILKCKLLDLLAMRLVWN